jgi:7-keto-8-aminopelargonate synthetase-like enzyme
VLEPEPLQQIDRTYVRFRGFKLSYFSGCDYFRLSTHPRVIAALKAGVDRYGLNVAASRLTTGNHRLYLELERSLGDFFGVGSALVVPSGFMTNLIVAQALAGSFSHALIDEKAHPSLSEAARMLDCPVLKFRHLDPPDLARSVKRCGPGAKLMLLTDGLFSRDGSVALLREYLKILPEDALLLVDDAHAVGILGERGRGSVEYHKVSRRRIVQTLTLSKAFGTYGGAVIGPASLHQRIFERSDIFFGSTPLPLPLANSALQAVKLLQGERSFRRRLLNNVRYVRRALAVCGFKLKETPAPILSLFPRHIGETEKLKSALLKARIFPSFIRYPGGPDTGYFRFVLSSEHTSEQLENLVGVLARYFANCVTSSECH